MKVTIQIRDDLYSKLRSMTEADECSIEEEIEKAVLLLTQKRTLVRRLMNETCDEFDEAMKKLAFVEQT